MLRIKTLASVLVFAGMAAAAQNATGTWKINVEKTDWGPSPAPKDLRWVVKEEGPKLSVVALYTRGDGVEARESYMFDKSGKETVNNNEGMEIRTIMREVGDELREESTATAPDGAKIIRMSTTRLSDDGKSLTQMVEIKTPDGIVKRRIMMERQ